MTHAGSTHPGHSAAAGQQDFSPQEVEVFQSDDRSAATAIVGLMVGIFTLGLLGYLVVCMWVRS